MRKTNLQWNVQSARARIDSLIIAFVVVVLIVPVSFGMTMGTMFVLANLLPWAVNGITVPLALGGPTLAGIACIMFVTAARLRLPVLLFTCVLTVGTWGLVFLLGSWL